MHNITDEQLSFMRADIKSRGIEIQDLHDNLIDHICCIVENEMKQGEDFETFYRAALPRFFREELKEIQIETVNLLRYKNYYQMKKTMHLSGLATVIFTTLGAVLKTMHLPGAGITIFLGGFLFSLVFLPLLIAIKFKDEESKVDKVVISVGLVLAILLSMGMIFKLMHWPYATFLLKYTTIVFTFLYVPVYFFSRVKRPAIRFNTIVNSVLMMACGGIFYSLFDLSYSHEFKKQMKADHIYLHENANRIISSNERLYLMESAAGEGINLHHLSQQLNQDIELISSIVEEKNSTANANQGFSVLKKRVISYNKELQVLGLPELQPIELKEVDVFEKLNTELAMIMLARLQQQIAVNENYYLITLLSTSRH